MTAIYIDADACPVKAETYAVAKQHSLLVWVVANQWMDMPNDPSIRLEVVDDGFDAADDWIAQRSGAGDIVITDDIPLAARCLECGAAVVTTRGVIRHQNTIGEALAMRELLQYAREAGDISGGNKPMDHRDRQHFTTTLKHLVRTALGQA